MTVDLTTTRRARQREHATCAGCGREVVGYVPATHVDGMPCCSQECARVISEREERARG